MKLKSFILVAICCFGTHLPRSFGQAPVCLNGLFLCSNDAVYIQNTPEMHAVAAIPYPCLPTDQWPNMITLFWEMAGEAGLEFSIIPNNPLDDIDFILYKVDPSKPGCADWNSVRCMAAGPRLSEDGALEPCTGNTGISMEGGSTILYPGCDPDQSNFLSAIDARPGDIYALTIINFTSHSGFILQFPENLQFSSVSTLPVEMRELDPSESNIYSEGCISLLSNDNTVVSQAPDRLADIRLFPNPTHKNLTADITDLSIQSYQILGSAGKELHSEDVDPSIQSQLLEIRSDILAPGVYLIRFATDNGEIITRQFVKTN